jgi:hypothetical protein
MGILRKTSQSSRRIAFDPEFHRQALPKRALTAMPWALQHLGDKNVSSSRRKTPSTVIRVPALPSGRKHKDRFGLLLSDEKARDGRSLVDGGMAEIDGQWVAYVAHRGGSQLEKGDPKSGPVVDSTELEC